MVKINIPKALRTPMASLTQADCVQSDTNSQIDHVQAPGSGATHGLLSGTNVEVGQAMSTRMPHPNAERSSRAKMWDPVKECSDSTTTPADLSGLFPDSHNSEQLMDSTPGNVPSTDPHSHHGDHRYGQARGARQQSTASGIRGATLMGPPPHPQSRTMVFGRQGQALMGSRTFQRSPSYDQSRRPPHQQSVYEDHAALDRLVNESLLQSRQPSSQSITGGGALLNVRPRRPNHLNLHSQENAQPMDMESRMPGSMVSQAHAASLPTSSSPSTQRRSDQLTIATGRDPQQADSSQHQSLLTTTARSQAISMGHYGESLEQQSNYTDAVRVYERACALLQEVIIKSPSFDERIECDLARNFYQGRLDELLRRSTATSGSEIRAEGDQEDDDDFGRIKPQYTLFEDYALCHKDDEDLSWIEVAQTPIFNGKRKHRSLSQRRHTISKMGGPQYHEAERLWTAEEDRKLRAMGDAGKLLGDINRKFPSRNAERCLDRYFRLKGYNTTSGGRTRAPQQARQDPVLSPPSTQPMRSSSTVARHQEHRLHPGSSPYQSAYQNVPTFDQHNFPELPLRTSPPRQTYPIPRANPLASIPYPNFQSPYSAHTSGTPSSSSISASTPSTPWDSAASADSLIPRTQGS